MRHYLGVDIGKTKIGFVLMKDKRTIRRKKVMTPSSKEKIIQIIKNTIEDFSEGIEKPLAGVGIGVPGPLDRERKKILNPPNLTALKNTFLSKVLEKETGFKIKMENDANCFVLGEAILGAGKKYKKVIGLTLGSGVGGGIVLKDSLSEAKIFKGAFGSAGEFGHMTIKFDGRKCSCGSFGCFEQYASEKFFKQKSKYSPKQLEDLAREGNKKALALYKEFGNYLGIGIANLVNILDPDIVIIGGSISKAWPFFLNETKKQARKRVLSPYSKKFVKIKISKLGDFAPAIGAALLWQ